MPDPHGIELLLLCARLGGLRASLLNNFDGLRCRRAQWVRADTTCRRLIASSRVQHVSGSAKDRTSAKFLYRNLAEVRRHPPVRALPGKTTCMGWGKLCLPQGYVIRFSGATRAWHHAWHCARVWHRAWHCVGPCTDRACWHRPCTDRARFSSLFETSLFMALFAKSLFM